MNTDDDRRFIIHRLKWVGLYLGIGLILVLVLPAPYDLISVFALFILINFLRVRGFMKRYGGISRIRDVLGYLFSSTPGNDQRRPLKYYCMKCGKEHNEIACPNCGSKAKRVG
jgi:hypothetical protein